MTKLVVTTSLREPGWDNTAILGGPVLEEVERLKVQPGRDVVCTGSVRLATALVGTGLVDEYRLFVHPTVVGRGRRLFPDGVALPTLELVECRSFRSGVVLLRYQPAQPSPAG